MTAALAVAFGGAIGALGRYGVGVLLRSLLTAEGVAGPLATLTVNVLGSFLLAWLVFSSEIEIAPALRLGLATGLLGAFTTFSTFELDLYRLFGERPGWGAVYLLASVILGLAAIVLGRMVALRH